MNQKTVFQILAAVLVACAVGCVIAAFIFYKPPTAFGDGRVVSAFDVPEEQKIHGTDSADQIELEWYRVHLGDKALVDLYDAMEAAMMALRPGVTVPSLPEEDVKKCFWAVIYDHPEIFWVDKQYFFYYDGDENVIAFDFYYWMDDKEQIESKLHDYEVAADTIIAGSGHAIGGSRLRTAYIWIGQATTYDDGDRDQDMSSVFDGHRSVCAGYTQALQFILLRAGVPVARIHGTANNPDEDGNIDGSHTWIAALINREILYYDITWDDISNPGTMDRYYGMDWNQLLETHVVYDDEAPRNNDQRNDVKEMTELVFEKAKGEYRKYYEPLCADVFGGMPDTMSAVISAAQTAVNSAS